MSTKSKWKKPNRIEQSYYSQLSGLFKPIFGLVKKITDPDQMIAAINNIMNSPTYNKNAEKIATKIATMVFQDNAKNLRQAARKSSRGQEIYNQIKKETQGAFSAPLQELIDRNATIIKTLPLDISQKVVEHVQSRSMQGARASDIAKEIQQFFPKTTKAKASLIARTETSKASTALTQVRSQNLGINWYVWRTSEDARVRGAHAHMEGVLCNFNNPPEPEVLNKQKSEGKYNAGEIYNCRCYAEPLVDYDDVRWPADVHYEGRIQKMSLDKFKEIQ